MNPYNDCLRSLYDGGKAIGNCGGFVAVFLKDYHFRAKRLEIVGLLYNGNEKIKRSFRSIKNKR